MPQTHEQDALNRAGYGLIERTAISDDVIVSTVAFLGCYETLVIGGSLDGKFTRYASRESAVDGHRIVVSLVKAAL